MTEQSKPPFPMAIPGVAVLLAAVVSGFYVARTRVTPSRPANPTGAVPGAAAEQTVDARLWQDPFSPKVVSDPSSRPAGTAPPTAADVRKQVARRLANLGANKAFGDHVLILPVMVPRTPYADDAETRVRTRYALVSALGTAGYQANDQRHLGYFDLSIQPPNFKYPRPSEHASEPDAAAVPLRVPYEWFTADRTRRQAATPGALAGRPLDVLVLWLDDVAFEFRPLTRLALLVDKLRRAGSGPDLWRNPGPTGNPGVRVKVLGPSSSTGLIAILEDPVWKGWSEGTKEDEEWSSWLRTALDGVEIFSSRATAADDLMRSVLPDGDSAWQFDCPRRGTWTMRWPGPAATGGEPRGLAVHRTTASDDRLCAVLVGELGRRGVDLSSTDEGRHHVAIVSEWDGFYGRALPITFAAAVQRARHRGPWVPPPTLGEVVKEFRARPPPVPRVPPAPGVPDAPQVLDGLYRFSYLQGVDGLSADAPRDGAGGAKSPPAEGVQAASERPDGTAQLDYIRRLAEKVRSQDAALRRQGKMGFSAIGVLGSDVYDKLLIIQTMQPIFPSAIFFTTDLDNRLTDARELSTTRNLVVVSAYGLELHPNLQNEIPPFRDSYQTAMYASCLQALGYGPFAASASVRLALPPEPRVFEIGRTGAIDLSPGGASSVHPPRLVDQREEKGEFIWPVLVTGTLGLALFVSTSRAARRLFIGGRARELLSDEPALWAQVAGGQDRLGPGELCRHAVNRAEAALDRAESVRVRLVVVVFAAAGLALLAVVFRSMTDDLGEPVALFEGVSVWPTEFVRLVAALLGVLFVVRGAFAMRRHNLKAQVEYGFPPDPDLRRRLPGTDGIDHKFCARVVARCRRDRCGYAASAIRELWSATVDHMGGARRRLIGIAESIPRWANDREGPGREDSGCTLPPEPAPTSNANSAPRGWKALGRWLWQRAKCVATRVDQGSVARAHRRLKTFVGMWDERDPPADARALWAQYLRMSLARNRRWRVCLWSLIYLAFGLSLFHIFGWPMVPARGEAALAVDRWVTSASVVALIGLTFRVMDATRLCEVFSQKLAGAKVPWPDDVRRWFAAARSMHEDDVGEWLDVRLIADRTAVVGRMIVGPFVVLSLMILARVRYFDRWDWPPSLVLIFSVNSLMALALAVMLRRTAEGRAAERDPIDRPADHGPEQVEGERLARRTTVADPIRDRAAPPRRVRVALRASARRGHPDPDRRDRDVQVARGAVRRPMTNAAVLPVSRGDVGRAPLALRTVPGFPPVADDA